MLEPVPVTLRDEGSWNSGLPAGAVGLLMMHLLNHDYTANEKRVFPSLGVDMKTRRKADNVPDVKVRQTHEYRKINKALSMELLSALLLTRLDSAREVFSWCETRNGLPHRYAPCGLADITASYPASGEIPAFRVVAEVSAKREVTRESYTRQLSQALDHAAQLAEKSGGEPVYALVINAGRIGSDRELQEVYRSFVKNKKIKPDGPVRLLPIYTGDLAVALRDLEVGLSPDRFRFGGRRVGGGFRDASRWVDAIGSERRPRLDVQSVGRHYRCRADAVAWNWQETASAEIVETGEHRFVGPCSASIRPTRGRNAVKLTGLGTPGGHASLWGANPYSTPQSGLKLEFAPHRL